MSTTRKPVPGHPGWEVEQSLDWSFGPCTVLLCDGSVIMACVGDELENQNLYVTKSGKRGRVPASLVEFLRAESRQAGTVECIRRDSRMELRIDRQFARLWVSGRYAFQLGREIDDDDFALVARAGLCGNPIWDPLYKCLLPQSERIWFEREVRRWRKIRRGKKLK